VRWYTRALELSAGRPPDPTLQAELLIGLGTAQRQAGEAAYSTTLGEAAAVARRENDPSLLVATALAGNRGYYSATGSIDEGRIAVLRDALRLIPRQDSGDRARLLAALAVESTLDSMWEARRALAEEAIAMARRLDDPATLVEVLNTSYLALAVPETLDQRLANTAEALSLASSLDEPTTEFWATNFRAWASMEAGDVREVDRCLDRQDVLAARLTQPLMRHHAIFNRAWRALVSGECVRAQVLGEQALKIGIDGVNPDAQIVFAGQLRGWGEQQGRLDEQIERLEATVAAHPLLPGLRASLAAAYVQVGRIDDARELLDEQFARGFDELPYDYTYVHCLARWAEVGARVGRPEQATALYQMLGPWHARVATILTSVGGPVATPLGALAARLGRNDEAEDLFAEGAELCERMGAPYFLAQNRVAWARALLAAPEGDDARGLELLGAASALAKRNGYAGIKREADALALRPRRFQRSGDREEADAARPQ